MLVTRDHQRIGTISGGCLEADVSRKGWWTTAAGPVVRVYDTVSDDDAVWEFGLGCQGVIEILLERTATSGCEEHLAFLQRQRESRTASVVATVVRSDAGSGFRCGDRLLVDDTGVHGGALVGTDIEMAVHAQARRSLESGQSVDLRLPGADVLVEVVQPPPSLLILGAGDDARPLSAMACALGWDVTVADGRPSQTRPERFPGARVVHVSSHHLRAGLDVDRHTLVVMMTHNFPFDVRLLPLVMQAQPAYLGMLGPRSRTARLFEACGLEQQPFVHAPVGLDLGGDTPAAIALSIMSEMQAHLSGRVVRALRERDAGIHGALPSVGVDEPRAARETTTSVTCDIALGR